MLVKRIRSRYNPACAGQHPIRITSIECIAFSDRRAVVFCIKELHRNSDFYPRHESRFGSLRGMSMQYKHVSGLLGAGVISFIWSASAQASSVRSEERRVGIESIW